MNIGCDSSQEQYTGTINQLRGRCVEEQQDLGPETEIERKTLMLIEHMGFSKGESDRGLVLFLGAQADSYLRDALASFVVDTKSAEELFEGPYAPFGSLSGKTKAAFLFGLITRSEMKCIDAIRRVRNIFAHEIDASFDHPEIRKLCAKPARVRWSHVR
jgi:hypothetical protein